MANIVITSTTSVIDVDFGHYWRGSETPYANAEINSERSVFPKAEVREAWKDGESVFVQMDNRREWKLGLVQGVDNVVVDSINGVAPTDATHLLDLVKTLL